MISQVSTAFSWYAAELRLPLPGSESSAVSVAPPLHAGLPSDTTGGCCQVLPGCCCSCGCSRGCCKVPNGSSTLVACLWEVLAGTLTVATGLPAAAALGWRLLAAEVLPVCVNVRHWNARTCAHKQQQFRYPIQHAEEQQYRCP